MINLFVVKKYAALLLCGFLSTISFLVANIYYGFLWAFVGFGIGLAFSVLLGTFLLKNPFTSMLEGKGILALNLDSTGIIKPFIVSLKPPYIVGKLGGNKVNDVFDRATVWNLTPPVENETQAKFGKDGTIELKLSEKDYNKSRFALFHYPVIIYNEQIKSLLTKDFFSNSEKDAYAEHGVLYLNRKLEELTSIVRDFGRYVVELTKPKLSFFEGKTWVIWLVLIIFFIILAMFAPYIWNTIKGGIGPATEAIQAAGGSGNSAITIR